MPVVWGQKFVYRTYAYQYPLQLIVWFRGVIKVIYQCVQFVVTSSFQGRQLNDGAGGFLYLLMLSALAIVIFLLEAEELKVFSLLTLAWLVDKGAASYFFLNEGLTTRLETGQSTAKLLEQPTRNLSQTFQHQILFPQQSAQVVWLERAEVKVGAFDQKIADVWRIQIQTNYQEIPLVVHEDYSVTKAYNQALKVAASFSPRLPVYFKNSCGFGENVQTESEQFEKVFPLRQTKNLIQVKKGHGGVEINYRWNLGSYYNLLVKISGIVVTSTFLVLIINLMGFWGGILLTSLCLHVFQDHCFLWSGNLTNNFIDTFLMSKNLVDAFEITIISLLILSNDLTVSLRKQIHISPDTLKYYLRRKCVGTLSTREIKNVMVIASPQPILLITDAKRALAISSLQTPEEFQAFLWRIAENTGLAQKSFGL